MEQLVRIHLGVASTVGTEHFYGESAIKQEKVPLPSAEQRKDYGGIDLAITGDRIELRCRRLATVHSSKQSLLSCHVGGVGVNA